MTIQVKESKVQTKTKSEEKTENQKVQMFNWLQENAANSDNFVLGSYSSFPASIVQVGKGNTIKLIVASNELNKVEKARNEREGMTLGLTMLVSTKEGQTVAAVCPLALKDKILKMQKGDVVLCVYSNYENAKGVIIDTLTIC